MSDVGDLVEPFDPKENDFWTPCQAFAWIRYRDVTKVRDYSESWQMICPAEDRRDIWRDFWGDVGCDYNASRDWNNKFIGSLVSGKVRANGESNGTRLEINALQWLDLRLYQISRDPSGLLLRMGLNEISVIREYFDPRLTEGASPLEARPQFYHKNKRFDGPTLPEPDFRDVRVRVADVLKEFPTKDCEGSSRPRGGRPPAADWPAIEEAFNKEVDLFGLPRKDAEPGWRRASEWLRAHLDDAAPGKTTVNKRAREMLERRMKRDGK